MNHAIVITPTALADIAEQIAYIGEDSPAAAARWYDGCLHAIESLESLPRRCSLAPEAEVFQREIRQLIYQSHRVLYEVAGDTVNVLHVRHGARLPLAPDVNLRIESDHTDDA